VENSKFRTILQLKYLICLLGGGGGGGGGEEEEEEEEEEEFSEDLHPPIPSHPGMKYPVRASPSLRLYNNNDDDNNNNNVTAAGAVDWEFCSIRGALGAVRFLSRLS
jgi:hypothetical protein